jgi:hypothetical protein
VSTLFLENYYDRSARTALAVLGSAEPGRVRLPPLHLVSEIQKALTT